MTQRKIAMVINSLGSGGVPEAVLNLCAHLPRDRFAPHLFVLKAATPSEPADDGFTARPRAAGVPVTIAQSSDGKIGTVAELADWIIAQRIDILHSHSFRPNLYARLAGAICRPSGLLIVAHYHNQYDDKWPEGQTALMLERHLAGVTDANVAVSASVRDHVAKVVGLKADRITVMTRVECWGWHRAIWASD
jgi:Glycosyltransferase Family 4